MRLVHSIGIGIGIGIGIERFISELAGFIEDDFRRWELFDKTPRVS